MTDNDKFDLILSKLDMLDHDMQEMKQRTSKLDDDMQEMKQHMSKLDHDMQEVKQRTTAIELHLENGTDKNIQLIAENFIELTKKLNQAIPVADKNLAYEVKVNYLVERVQLLEKEVAELKNKTA